MPVHCELCNLSFPSAAARRSHVRTSVEHLVVFSCRICNDGKGYLDTEALSTHLQTHSRKQLEVMATAVQSSSMSKPSKSSYCDICRCDIPNRSHIRSKQHCKLAAVPPESRFYCPTCNKGFTAKSQLKAHTSAKKHAIGKPSTTSDLLESFEKLVIAAAEDVAAAAESKSVKTKKIKPSLSCPDCKRTGYKSQRALDTHLASIVHNPLLSSRLPCAGAGCGKRFKVPSAMCHHLESGFCRSGATRAVLDELFKSRDRGHVYTVSPEILDYSSDSDGEGVPLYTPPSSGTTSRRSSDASSGEEDQLDTIPTCAVCEREFGSEEALRMHEASPVHAEGGYLCHVNAGDKRREWVCLSALVQHLEAGACEGGLDTFMTCWAEIRVLLREVGDDAE